MSKAIFLTGTGTDIGKTFIAGLIVKKLAGAGIINGRDNNMFEPEGSLSRAEAAVLLLRYFTELGVIK